MNLDTTINQANGLLLIVDDEPVNLSALEYVLAPHYELRAANAGESVLRLARLDPLPDLILLDVMMPGMDGYEVLRQLRSDIRTRAIPVIFITALNDSRNEVVALTQGAVDYIHKPIEPTLVLARVRTQLEAKSARDLLHEMNSQLGEKVSSGVRALEDAQRRVVQLEKMASLGQLAAGVAHELNNPISYVQSNIGTLQNYIDDLIALVHICEQAARGEITLGALASAKRERDFDYLREDVLRLLSESSDGLSNMKKMVQDLKGFSRTNHADWIMADLAQIIDSSLNIVWNELKYKCKIIKQYANDLPLISCVPSQLSQVFINLLTNAAHAIVEKGTITLSVERGGDTALRVRIADTGEGIASEHLAHIFEPFFTTKPPGVGTGLGLYISADIVAKHKGSIEVSSTPSTGTAFSITLPIKPSHATEKSDGVL